MNKYRFKQLLESQMGNVKPLILEYAVTTTTTSLSLENQEKDVIDYLKSPEVKKQVEDLNRLFELLNMGETRLEIHNYLTSPEVKKQVEDLNRLFDELQKVQDGQ